MPISPAWKLVDSFTLIQAAYLWNDIEPPANSIIEITKSRPAAVSAILQALRSADNRTLSLVSKNQFSVDEFQIEASRDGLIRFARSKGQFPAFLFDTLAPDNEVLAEQFDDVKGTRSLDSSPPQEKGRQRSVGGRPDGYDWNAAMVELVRVAELDNLPRKQADMVRHLKTWFANKYQSVPSDTQIKTRIVSPIYNGLEENGCIPSRTVSD
jgi:hypothetical protein